MAKHRLMREYPHAQTCSTIAGAVASLMMTLDMTIVLVALPDIARSLTLSLSGSQWVVNAYSLAFATLLLGVGSLSDLIGRRMIFILGQVLFVLASIGCVTADGETWLVVARAVQGAGGAMVFGSSIPLVSDAFGPGEEKKRTSAIAVLMAAGAAAAALGPLFGGAIIQWLDWEYIFAINIPIGVAIIALTLWGVPPYRRTSTQESTPPIDWGTLVLASLFLFLLNYGILTGPEEGWTATKVIVSFVVSVVALVVLIWVQLRKGERAMIDVRMFGIPSFSAVTIVAFAARLFSFGMMPYIVLWLSGAANLSALQVGYVSTAIAGPMILCAPVAIGLAKRISVGVIQALGMAVVALGLLLGLLVDGQSGWSAILPMYIVVGMGTGLMLPHLMDVAVAVVPAHKTGTATGIANTAFPLGTSFGVAIYGAIVTAAVSRGLGDLHAPQKVIDLASAGQFQILREKAGPLAQPALDSYINGLHHVLILAAVLAILGAILAATMIRDRDRLENKSATRRDDREAMTSA